METFGAYPALASDMVYSMQKKCVYTALIGDYEAINEQPASTRSDITFICFTDDPSLTSETWQIRYLSPILERDPIRSQRELKFRPHLHLPEFDASLYIDNSVILNEGFETIFDLLAQNGEGIALSLHSFRNTVMDEFLAVSRAGLDDGSRVFEQLNHYLLDDPECLQEQPWWGGMILRDHRNSTVRAAMETWLMHVMRYARRDQLSLNFVLRKHGLHPFNLAFDNHKSDFHSWPHATDRDRKKGDRNLAKSLMPFPARLRETEMEMEKWQALYKRDVKPLRDEVERLKKLAKGSQTVHSSGKEVISFTNGVSLNTYPISLRVGSTCVGQDQIGAYEISAPDATGKEVLASIFRGRVARNDPDTFSSAVDIYMRSFGATISAISMSTPNQDNSAFLVIAARLDGKVAARRLQVGPEGSGPGGTGRALYVAS